jgi:GrpB-like predicted nucleotidyltransferase (UPF0157 family)
VTDRKVDRHSGRTSGAPPPTAGSSLYTSDRSYQPGRPFAAQQPAQRSRGQLHGYDSRWPRVFAAERRRIGATLGSLAIAIEHVGSSAIPGLWGRPEIDIIVGVSSSPDVDTSTRVLMGIGYLLHDRGPPGGEPWSLLLRPVHIPFELLVVEHGGPLWNRQIYLRDYLRRDPQRATAYGRLKSRWAARYGAGTPEYQQAKREYWTAIAAPSTTISRRGVPAVDDAHVDHANGGGP